MYLIYADIESLIKKNTWMSKNSRNSSPAEKGGHIPCWYSKSTTWAFDHIENKHALNCGKYCISFVIFKRIHEKYNWFSKRKKMLPLKKEQLKSHQDSKVCHIWWKRISLKV